MLNIIIHPYDIIEYLSLRDKWLLGAKGLPTFAIGDSENTVLLSKIDNEQDFISFFEEFSYYNDMSARNNSLRLLSIISKYKERESIKYKGFDRNYKKIIKNFINSRRSQRL